MIHGEPVRIMLRASDTPDGADAMIGFEAGDRRLTTRLLTAMLFARHGFYYQMGPPGGH